MNRVITGLFIVISVMCFHLSFAEDISGSISSMNREIIERLIRLEEGQKALNQRIDERFADVNQRIDDVNENLSKRIDDVNENLSNRIDDVNNRIDDVNNRIDDIHGLMLGLLAGMFVLVGFVIWDRRTALMPAVKKAKELEKSNAIIQDALIEYSHKHSDLAEVLKSFGLL